VAEGCVARLAEGRENTVTLCLTAVHLSSLMSYSPCDRGERPKALIRDARLVGLIPSSSASPFGPDTPRAGDEVRRDLFRGLGRRANLQVQPEVARALTVALQRLLRDAFVFGNITFLESNHG
jgi:hypothetical protein